MALTPEQEARYALNNKLDRASLPPAAQLEYDRLLAERIAAAKAPGSGAAAGKVSRRMTTDQVEAAYAAGRVPGGSVPGGAAPPGGAVPPRGAVPPGSPAMAVEYARQTRNAVVFIAWVVGIFAVVSLIGGIVMGVSLIHAVNNSNGSGASNSSNCLSQGGTDPSC